LFTVFSAISLTRSFIGHLSGDFLENGEVDQLLATHF